MKTSVFFLAILVTSLASACQGTSTPEVDFTSDQVIQMAMAQAKQSRPEVGILDARVDSATAELITLAEVERRANISIGGDPQMPIWWVTVYGCFVYEGFPMPTGYPLYFADRQEFTFTARRVATPAPGTVVAPIYGGMARIGPSTPVGTVPANRSITKPTPRCFPTVTVPIPALTPIISTPYP